MGHPDVAARRRIRSRGVGGRSHRRDRGRCRHARPSPPRSPSGPILYGALFVVIDRYFQRGVRWSRYLLAGLLGTVGTASLVAGPIGWLLDHDLSSLDWGPQFLLTAILRSVHLTAVLTALVLSFHPDTNRWFGNAKTA